jgi:HSP20 family protein
MVHFRFPIHQLPSALQDFATEMETIVDHVLNKNDAKGEDCECPTKPCNAYVPSIDINESETHFDLFMDLPGVKIEDVKIEMQDDRLMVSGTRQGIEASENSKVHRKERTTGAFSRSIRLPKQLDTEKIEAQFDNGVLHVMLPKQVKPSPRTIEIKKV